MVKPKLLVHICCAPDALYVMDLLSGDYDLLGYFDNPNIHPRSEYDLRLSETRRVADVLKFKLYEGPSDPEGWLNAVRRFRDEPEKGRRCDICYALRLDRTARLASVLGCDLFTTVMSLSPWKKAVSINRIGSMLARRHGIGFLAADFKKKDGFRRSVALSRQHDLYRQDYCGCRYSRR